MISSIQLNSTSLQVINPLSNTTQAQTHPLRFFIAQTQVPLQSFIGYNIYSISQLKDVLATFF